MEILKRAFRFFQEKATCLPCFSKLNRNTINVAAEETEVIQRMTKWAANAQTLSEFHARAEALGNFILRCSDEAEMRAALMEYVKQICELPGIPGWIRFDILSDVEKYLVEPELEELYGKIITVVDSGHELIIWSRIETYHAADDARRDKMRAEFSPEVLGLLDQYYVRAQICRLRQDFLYELYQMIETLGRSYGL